MGYQPNIPKHYPGDTCPGCYPKGGELEKRIAESVFLGCSRYPDCKYTAKWWGWGKRKESRRKKVKES